MTAPSLPRNSHLASLTLLERQGFTGATVLDIGAAEGAFFLHRHMQKLFLSAKHFFIDAMQENEAVYEKLKRAFGTDHAITALSCVEGEVAVRIDPTFYNTHLVGLQTERYEETRRVRLMKLDSVVAERGLVGPYVLKLDVQGAEVDVLRGSLKTLEQATVVVAEIQIFHERDNLLDLLFFRAGGLCSSTSPTRATTRRAARCISATRPSFRSEWTSAKASSGAPRSRK